MSINRQSRSALVRLVRRLHRDDSGATSIEYMMILVFVIMPIALMYPMFMKMVRWYGSRMTALMGLPFP